MKQYKHFLALLFMVCTIMAMGIPAHANIPIVTPGATGSITIHSLAVENTGDYTAPGAGSLVENAPGEPIANISYTITQVPDTVTTPDEAKEMVEDNAFTQTETTNVEGLAEFKNLAQGVYLVEQTNSTAVQVTTDDFLVSIPMTNAAGNGWIYDVFVYPKYQLIGVPAINAYVTKTGNLYDSLNLMDTARWFIASEVPADIGTAANYQLQVILHDALDYRTGSLLLYTETDGNRTTLVNESDYTVEVTDAVITITLQKAGQEKLAGALPTTGTLLLYAEVPTILDIPAQALEATLGTQIPIEASLHYTSSLNREHTVTPDGNAPYIYTGGFHLINYHNRIDTPLEGSAFKVYRTEDDALAGDNAVPTPGNEIDWTAVTGPAGTASFFGLSYGGLGIPNDTGSHTYYLVQTQAPANYNLLRSPVPVTVNAASHEEANQIEVQGRTGFLLPATGGIGTFWFTFGGLAIIGLAVYYYLRSRKKDGHHRPTER